MILLLGVLVLLEIVSCNETHEKIKSRFRKGHESHKNIRYNNVRKGHKFHNQLAHHDVRKGHTVTRLNGPLSPPASNNDQEKFYRYLEKWEKFSKPETKWHKDDIKKTSHDEKKKIVHVKKDEKINPDQFKHMKHKLARDETHKKSEKKSFGKKDNRKQMKGDMSMRDYYRKYAKDMTKRRFSGMLFNGRRNRDYTKKRFHHRRHNELRKKLGKDVKLDKKPLDLKLDEKLYSNMKMDGYMKNRRGKENMPIRTHPFGRPAHGNTRRNDKRIGHKNTFCLKRQNRKCPDFKREVCGSDGKTYQNRCLFMEEMCKKDSKTELKLLKRGPCEERKTVQ